MNLIRATDVVQRFGASTALGPLDLEVGFGERLAVIGDNGAGKTTLLRILATLARPTSGRLELWGMDAVRRRDRLRPRLGYQGHQPGMAPLLTALENLDFYATLHGLGPDRACEALEMVGMERAAHVRAGDLSRGMLQRLALARAVLHEPELLILDEPDASLDTAGKRLLDTLLEGRTVVLASHDRALVRKLCGRGLLLKDGRNSGDPLALSLLPTGGRDGDGSSLGTGA